jgi:hypothetical protein
MMVTGSVAAVGNDQSLRCFFHPVNARILNNMFKNNTCSGNILAKEMKLIVLSYLFVFQTELRRV